MIFLELCSGQILRIMVLIQIWIISMGNKNEIYLCRVCGLEQLEPPWGDDGKSATFDICDCCGVEFGYEDATLSGIRRYREKWLTNGAKWNTTKSIPDNWMLHQQLKKSRCFMAFISDWLLCNFNIVNPLYRSTRSVIVFLFYRWRMVI